MAGGACEEHAGAAEQDYERSQATQAEGRNGIADIELKDRVAAHAGRGPRQ
ncbi:MAG: hypothetical protein V1750_06045 [Acidobacteriota bacterium]